MDFNELKQAAKIFARISDIRHYVSKERFATVAQVRFNITDKMKIGIMYDMFQEIPRMAHEIAIFDNKKARKQKGIPEFIDLLPQAIEIAVAAYSLRLEESFGHSVPHIEYEEYRRSDIRRYFYTLSGESLMLDVSLSSKGDLLLLAELLRNDCVMLRGTVEHLGYLDGELKGVSNREKFQYFDGDIYFLFGTPTDRLFYSYVDCNDAGVFVATKKGWRKLLYTPSRGYVESNGNLNFVDDKKFYSDYMLEMHGRGFLYVGNIHNDISVLMEKKNDKNESENGNEGE